MWAPPPQVISPRARPYLSREGATLAAPQTPGAGHPGPRPPLHRGDPTDPAPEAAPGASLHSQALSSE